MRKVIGTVVGMILLLMIATLSGVGASGNAAFAQEAPGKTPSEPGDEFQEALKNGRLLASQGRPEEAIVELQRAAKIRDQKCAECFQLIGYSGTD